MKKTYKIFTLFSIILFLPMMSAYAVTKCVGMDVTGKTINVIVDNDTSTINVNGDVLKITSQTKNKKGVSTENYQTDRGHNAYVSYMPPEADSKVGRIYQFNADNDKVISEVSLSCHESE